MKKLSKAVKTVVDIMTKIGQLIKERTEVVIRSKMATEELASTPEGVLPSSAASLLSEEPIVPTDPVLPREGV